MKTKFNVIGVKNAPAIVHHQENGLNKQVITVQEQHPCDCLYW